MPRSSAAAQALPPSEKVRKRSDYVRIQTSGRKLTSPNLLAFVASSDGPRPRAGITVSRRVGNAVRRNQVKRYLREAFRQQKQCFPRAIDVVFVARSEAARVGFSQIFTEVAGISQRVIAWR